jgi:hypothetical protein
MKIAVVQRADVMDVRSLSGIPYFAVQALEKHVGEIIFLGPDNSLLTRLIENSGRLLNRLSYFLFRRRISSDHHRVLSKRLALAFGRRLARSDCDVIFSQLTFRSSTTQI